MGQIDLRGCAIAVAPDRQGFVDQAVLDLAAFTEGRVLESPEAAVPGTAVLVGKDVVREAARLHAPLRAVGLDGISDQGFVLRTVRCGDTSFVVCSGGGARGDAYALIELIRSADRRGGRVLIDDTDRREEPFFTRRGMYAHQHWAYEHPYALRSWRFEDWKSYIDLLAYLKINLFCIWSMAAILPCPLSDADREYLRNYHRVIDYARNRRGMEVFIGECANNIARDTGDKPIQHRDYFEVEVLNDPSDPAQFAEIMDNRRELYRAACNADGYWIIDSDPGGFEGSPPEELVDIMLANRELIDKHTDRGPDAKLAYWMWMGWGQGKPEVERQQIVRRTLELVRDRLKEPWVLFACTPNHVDYAREMGYMDKSVFMPYGIIEDEPSPPTTRIRFGEMYARLNDFLSRGGGRSAMGNAQSPLVQLPNIFFFAETAWRGLPAAEPAHEQTLRSLADLLAPDIADELAGGWAALDAEDPEEPARLADRLDRVVSEGEIGSRGALAPYYSPGVSRLASDLAMQLRAHSRARKLCAALARGAPFIEVEPLLLGYHDAALAWHETHGFRRYHCYGPDVWEIAERWREYGRKASVTGEYIAELKRALLAIGHDEWTVDGYIALTTAPEQEATG